MYTRRLILTGVLLAMTVSAALAAPISGKVHCIRKQVVCVVLSDKPAVWVKKGAGVRFLGARGTITEVVADTVKISTPRFAKTKVGEVVTLEKPRANVAGC